MCHHVLLDAHADPRLVFASRWNVIPGMTGPPNCARPSHTDHHFVSTASCVKTTHAPPTEKLGCHEIDTNISSAYEN